MADQMLVICFTDLRGSPSLTEKLGHNTLSRTSTSISPSETLTALAGGRYVKNMAMEILATFQSDEHAISFALQLQNFIRNRHCLKRPRSSSDRLISWSSSRH